MCFNKNKPLNTPYSSIPKFISNYSQNEELNYNNINNSAPQKKYNIKYEDESEFSEGNSSFINNSGIKFGNFNNNHNYNNSNKNSLTNSETNLIRKKTVRPDSEMIKSEDVKLDSEYLEELNNFSGKRMKLDKVFTEVYVKSDDMNKIMAREDLKFESVKLCCEKNYNFQLFENIVKNF